MYQITRQEIAALKQAPGLNSSYAELTAQLNVNKQISGGMIEDFYLGFASALKMISETTSDKSQLLTIAVLIKRTVEFL